MPESRDKKALIDQAHTAGTPSWWTDQHASLWDHVKGAIERDWVQTKADFSRSGGRELNQNIVDTVRQSVGSLPIPPLEERNRSVSQTGSEAPREGVVTEELEISDIRTILADRQAQATRAFVGSSDPAAGSLTGDGMAVTQGGVAPSEAEPVSPPASWQEAEQGLRFGYCARSRYPATGVWDDKVETTLRAEWDALGTGLPWHWSRTVIRHGWDSVGRTL